jgi:O-antigen/teichoic acid export membrane protein
VRGKQREARREGQGRKRKVLKNSISSLLIYAFLLLFSVVSSKFVLVSYGSETNGLLSSVNQLFSYIALLEAGIGTSTISALYRPMAENDEGATAEVLSSSRYYYRTTAKWYLACVLAVAFLWPLVIKSTIAYASIFLLIFLQGVSGVLTYWFTSAAVNYLVARGSNFVNNRVHLLATLTTYALKILICTVQADIVFISAASIAVNALQCLIYYLYLRKNCPIYFVQKKPDKSLLKQRNSFLIHEISGVIFSSTDTIILSIFCGLTEASVYAVYSMVTNALRTVIGQIFNGTNYVLGSSYADPDVRYEVVHDRYNAVYQCLAFVVFTIAYYLILPFLTLYTAGITDADYLDVKLPILFVMIELLSTCRAVDNQLVRISLHAKQTVNRAIIEAVINIVVSVTAVQFIGIYGVLLGTIAALLYRTNDFILYANRKILKRSTKKEYILVLTNFAVFIGFVLLRERIPIVPSSYLCLIVIAVPVSIAIAAVYAAINYVLNRFVLGKMI